MELNFTESNDLAGLLADDIVMDWLLKLEEEDAAAELAEEEAFRHACFAE